MLAAFIRGLGYPHSNQFQLYTIIYFLKLLSSSRNVQTLDNIVIIC